MFLVSKIAEQAFLYMFTGHILLRTSQSHSSLFTRSFADTLATARTGSFLATTPQHLPGLFNFLVIFNLNEILHLLVYAMKLFIKSNMTSSIRKINYLGLYFLFYISAYVYSLVAKFSWWVDPNHLLQSLHNRPYSCWYL